jgi:hypothetical protein
MPDTGAELIDAVDAGAWPHERFAARRQGKGAS